MVELSSITKASVALNNQVIKLAISLNDLQETTFVTKGEIVNSKYQQSTVTLSSEHTLSKKVKVVPTMEQKGLVFF